MFGKKLLSVVMLSALLTTQYAVFPQTFTASAVNNSSECLPASAAFTFDTLEQLQNGDYQASITLSQSMLNNNSWKNSDYYIVAGYDETIDYYKKHAYQPVPYDFENMVTMKPAISGNKGTFTFSPPPAQISTWDNDGREYFWPTRYIGIVNAHALYYQSGSGQLCSGFEKARRLPSSKSYSFVDTTNTTYTVQVDDVLNNDDTSVRVTLTSPLTGGTSVVVNGNSGLTLTPSSPSRTLTGITDNAILSFTPNTESFAYSLVRPAYREFLGTADLYLHYSARPSANIVDYFFSQWSQTGTNANTITFSNPYTHYRYVYQNDSRSTWISYTPTQDTDRRYKYSIPNMTSNVKNVEFITNPSKIYNKSRYVGSNKFTIYTYVLNQLQTRTTVTPPAIPDTAPPYITGVTFPGTVLVGSQLFTKNRNIAAVVNAIDPDGSIAGCAVKQESGNFSDLQNCSNMIYSVPGGVLNMLTNLYFRAQDASGKVSSEFGTLIGFDSSAPELTGLNTLQSSWRNAPFNFDVTCTDVGAPSGGGSGCKTIRSEVSSQKRTPATLSPNAAVINSPTISTFTANTPGWFYIEATDYVGNSTGILEYQIQIDSTIPTISPLVSANVDTDAISIIADGGKYLIRDHEQVIQKAVTFNQSTGKYYTNDPQFLLTMKTEDTQSGVNTGTCTIKNGENIILDGCITQSGELGGTYIAYKSPIALSDGEYTYTLTVSDRAGNPAPTSTVRVVVDTSAPTPPTPGTITPVPDSDPDANGNTITYTIPNLSDLGGSGIDRIEVSLTQNGQPFTIENSMLGDEDPRITVENGLIIIRPDINGLLPTTLQIINLPGTVTINDEEVQAEYQALFTIYDRSGNSTPVVTPTVRFDTLAPTILGLDPVGSTIAGDGTSDNPYRVGNTRLLPLAFSLQESSNSDTNTPSLPLTIQLQGEGIVLAEGESSTGCDTADNGECTLPIIYSIDEGFNGEVQFSVRDSAGNTSGLVSRFITQSNGAPEVANPDVNAPDGDVIISPSIENRFNGDRLQITLRNVSMGGAEQLNATLRYTEQSNEQNILNATVTPGGEQDSYILSFTFPSGTSSLREGSQTVQLILSNEFGNSNETSPITIPLQYDSISPSIAGFGYSWNDDTDRVTLQWDSIMETSNTINLEYRINQDGSATNWSNTAITSGQSSFELPVAIASDDATVDVRFNDGNVYTLTTEGAEELNPNTTSLQVARKDIVINFDANIASESLLVTFAAAAGVDVSTIESLITTLTQPGGTTQVSTIPPVPENNTLFTITDPRTGLYEALSELRYTNNSMGELTFNKSENIPDIIAPEGSLTLTPHPAITEQSGNYYVSGEDTVDLAYAIDAQKEESYPVAVSITSTYNGTTTTLNSIADLTGSNPNNTISVPVMQDGTYELNAVFTDSAGLSSNASLTIIKDSSIVIVSTRLLDSTNQPITLLDSNNDLYTKERSGLKVEVIVANEQDSLQYFVNSQPVTNGEIIAGLPAGQVGVRLPLADLTDNDLNTLTMRVVDTATNEGVRTTRVRVDNQAPTITGSIIIPSEISDNPITLEGVTITDYSPVRYRVSSVSGILEGVYTNGISLPEGTNAFTLSFLDTLNNTVEVNNGETFTVFVDSQSPVATATITPDRTKERSAVITISGIEDISDEVTYEVAKGAIILSSGTIARNAYASIEVPIDLTPIVNTSSNLVVRLRDQVDNTRPITLTIVQDEEGPVVSSITTSTVNGGIGVGWTFTVTDTLSAVSSVTGVVTNTTTGETFSIAQDSWQSGGNGAYIAGLLPPNVRAENTYVLTVSATDELTNTTENASSTPFTMPVTIGNDDDDPLNDGPEIDPDITGTIIDVRVTNGRDIDFTAEDLPRGTQIILDFILDEYNEQNPNAQIPILPIGEYTITITDELGNTQTSTHMITPYYLSLSGDLNGDGFAGGITDHRLFILAKNGGRYDMNIPAIAGIVNNIDTIITNLITSNYSQFLEEV